MINDMEAGRLLSHSINEKYYEPGGFLGGDGGSAGNARWEAKEIDSRFLGMDAFAVWGSQTPFDLHLQHYSFGTQWLLRAGAILQQPFCVSRVADMLGSSPLKVLPHLQEAVRGGVLTEHESGFSFRDSPLRVDLRQSFTGGGNVSGLQESGRGRQELTEDVADDHSFVFLSRAAERMKTESPKTAADLLCRLAWMLSVHDERRYQLAAESVRLLAITGHWSQSQYLAEKSLWTTKSSHHRAELLCAIAETSQLYHRSKEAVEATGRALSAGELSAKNTGLLRSVRAQVLLDEQTGLDTVGEPEELAASAISQATVLDDAENLACGYTSLSLVALERGALTESVHYATEAVRAANRTKGPARQRHPRTCLIKALISADRLEEAQDALTEDWGESERFGTLWSKPQWHLFTAEIDWRCGYLDRARAKADMGVRTACLIQGEHQTSRCLALLAQISLDLGEQRQAHQHVCQAFEALDRSDLSPSYDLLWANALVEEALNGPEAALASIERLTRREDVSTRLLVRVPQAAPRIMRWAQEARVPAAAAPVVNAARALAGNNPGVAQFSATALHVEGTSTAKPELLMAAVEAYTHTNLSSSRTAALEDLVALRGSEAPEDPHIVRRTDAELFPKPRGAQKPYVHDPDLTTAEFRVARLVAQGLTNSEVAGRLHLSPHTVDSHLRHSFNKLGISSRVKLTRWVLANDEGARSELMSAAGAV